MARAAALVAPLNTLPARTQLTRPPSSPPPRSPQSNLMLIVAVVSGANLAKFGVDPLPSSEKAVQVCGEGGGGGGPP
jgi:hypothetical protein